MNTALNVETPKEAARRLSAGAAHDGYKPEALHVYADASGNPVYWRIRRKHPITGEKWIRPMHRNGTGYAIGEPPAPVDGKLLYRLPDLLAADPADVVLIVEGEWCADHLHRLGLIVTTSGSAVSAGSTDFRPLRGRHCLIWRDNDEAGRKYADEVAAILRGLDCTVEMIDVEALGLPDKGDAVDWLANNPEATAADVLALSRRVEVEAEPPPIIDSVSLFSDDGQKRSQATVLTEIGKRHHLFHDGSEAYARIHTGDHAEVFLIASADYRDCLSRAYYELSGSGANRNAIGDAISTLSAMARFSGPCEPVHLRIGASNDGIVIDDGGSTWGCIAVDASGWRIASDRIVNFRRSGKPLALPTPTTADLSRLWNYVNVEEADRVLVVAWLLSALRPHGPYPILLLLGEQGTGKSQSSRTLKRFTDPSSVPLRAPPRDDKDLLVAALSSWVLALDNLSGASPQMSDALCRLSTGGGFSARRLYTDADETLIAVQRPVILNGIDDLASRPDLAERCIHLTLPPLRQRATEAEMAASFVEDAGPIMAAMLDGLALALRDVNTIEIGALPRMADFAKWAAAGVPAMGFTREQFITAHQRNQSDAVALGLESSSVASGIRTLVEHTGTWTGTARALLSHLNENANEGDRHQPGWPHSTKGLQTTLRRLAPSLRHVGIECTRSRDAANQYLTLSCQPVGHLPQVPQQPWEPVSNGTLVDMAVAREVCTMTDPVEFDL